jgi:hypothetical protein
VFVGEQRERWTRVAVESWPRGVVWQGWVEDLSATDPRPLGAGGGGSAEGIMPLPAEHATATCATDVPLFVVGPPGRFEVGVHEAGSALVLRDDQGDTATVMLHDHWAGTVSGWHFEAVSTR